MNECKICKLNFEATKRNIVFCSDYCRKENKRIADREYAAQNKENKKAYDLIYYAANFQHKAEYAKQYKQKTKHLRWAREREILKNSFSKRFYKSALTIIKCMYKRGGVSTIHSKTFAAMGYNSEQLKERLISTIPKGHNWQSYIDADLHIDHIIPHSEFKYDSIDDVQFKECWALSNLRLREKHLNIKRNQ